MLRPLLLPLPGNESWARALAAHMGAEVGTVHVRRFPDGERYVRLATPVGGRSVALACTLRDPDEQVLALCFAAAAARDLGARRIGLVAPYLAYMRQDARFRDGEAITSVTFGALLSSVLDWLVTVDPHLHRHRSLAEVYRIPAVAVSAAPAIAAWVRREHPDAVVVGPDAESRQWAAAVAEAAAVPWLTMTKSRQGDHDVAVSAPDLDAWRDRTPVVLDDIVSTASTMAAAVARLRAAGCRPPVCVGVHAVFAPGAAETLAAAGAARIVTCSTIPHATNAIDVTPLLAEAVLGCADVAAPAGTR